MSRLLEKTRQLLSESPESLVDIAKKHGVGYHWLAKFHQGKISNPGVNTVESLYDYLIEQKK